jgi:hypothetical protein
MNTTKLSFRVWPGVLLISAGALSLRAIWAEPIGSMGPGQQVDNCQADFQDCETGCRKAYDKGDMNGQDYGACVDNCAIAQITCLSRVTTAIGLHPSPTSSPTNPTGLPISNNPPPNAAGPNPTPSATPREHPIGPPRKLGPNPTPSPTPRRHPIGPPRKLGPSPSPTTHPILLAKPTSPTPSPNSGPKKSGSHGHH